MGKPAGWMKELTGRSPMKSPGAPSLRRDVERLFWREIAKGLSSEEAGVAEVQEPGLGAHGEPVRPEEEFYVSAESRRPDSQS